MESLHPLSLIVFKFCQHCWSVFVRNHSPPFGLVSPVVWQFGRGGGVESLGHLQGLDGQDVICLLGLCPHPLCAPGVEYMYLAWYVGWESLNWGGRQGLSWPYWPLPWLGSSGSSSALHLGLEGPRPAHHSPVLSVQKGLTKHSQLNWRQCEPRECGNTSACLRVAALASPLGTHLLMSRLAPFLSPPALPSGWYKLAWRQGKCRKKVGHHLQGWTEKLGWWKRRRL